jgi:hypothetical protein
VSDSWKARIARRPVLSSLGALFGLGIAGSLIYEGPRLLGRRYPHTKYDDLLDQLPDRESAAKLGRVALADEPQFDPKSAADALRHGAANGSLPRAIAADVAQGRLVEVQGWVLPESLVRVSSIAAKMSGANG